MSLVGTIKASNGTNSQEVRADTATRALEFIDYAHHEIHAGSHYTAFHSAEGKNAGTTINIYLKTPNTTKWFHMFSVWSASGAAYFRVYEAPTITANTGSHSAPINNNRNSLNLSAAIDNAAAPAANSISKDVTKTVDGTIILEEYAGTGKTVGGTVRNDAELILKQNTVYCFEVESDALGLTLSFILAWYEHTDQVT